MALALDALDFRSVSTSRIFLGVPPADLGALVASGRVVEEPAGKLLIEEGRANHRVFLILSGSVEFFLPAGGGQSGRPTNVTLNTLGPGECFGEYGALDDSIPSASGVTVAPSRFCVWNASEFLAAVDGSDRLGRIVYGNIARVLVSRLRRKDEELDLPFL